MFVSDEFQVAGLNQSPIASINEGSTGNTLILDLAVNDRVWIKLYQGGHIYGSPEKISTFSGFLIN